MALKTSSFILPLLLAAAPAVAAGDQFDLVCTAKETSQRYRVDLARGEWCADQCDLVQKIASVTSGTLVLADHQPSFRGDRTSYNRVNRTTGEWEWFYSRPDQIAAMDHKGKCEPAAFSGLPAANRKF